MEELHALAFLNETPHHFNSIGAGVELAEKIGGGIEVLVKRNKELGGIDVSWGGNIYHFVFNTKTQKWGFPRSRPVIPC